MSEPPLTPDEVDDQEAVKVPGPEDTSILTAEPTGAVHGDEETVDRAGATED
ncbi:MAG: hypothetical protein M3203_16630 [Actinomycetota bacterium]|nr:hypothetical protein [Actinomycetota bacterium]